MILGCHPRVSASSSRSAQAIDDEVVNSYHGSGGEGSEVRKEGSNNAKREAKLHVRKGTVD